MVAAKNNVVVKKTISELRPWDIGYLPEYSAISGADYARTGYELYWGSIKGSQSASTGSASVSQSLRGDTFSAIANACKDTNGDGLADEVVESFIDVNADTTTLNQQATTSNSVSTSQKIESESAGEGEFPTGEIFLYSIAVKDTDYDGNINEYAQAGAYNVDIFTGMSCSGDWYYIDYSGILNAETSATTSNSASASMKFNLKDESGQSYITGFFGGPGYLGLTAARDNDNDGTIDERTDTYVDGDYIYQFNANGWAVAKDYGNTSESYMEGYGSYAAGGDTIYGYAYAYNNPSSSDARPIDINNINFMLHAWVDENGVPGTSTNP